MPVKTVEVEGKTYAELAEDGKVLYVGSDGAEVGYDGEALAARVTELNGEAATRRREAREAKEALAKFDGIEDPAAAKEALETVANLDAKKLIDAGKVEQIKTEAIKAVDDKWKNQVAQQYEPAVKERDELKTALHKEMIGGRFARSKYISEKMTLPPQVAQATFGEFFSIEDGRVVARDAAGNEIFSPSNPGERASFDEALERLVQNSPYRDDILKGPNKNGSGAPGSGGGGGGGAKTMTRSEFNAMAVNNPGKLAELSAEGLVVTE